MEVGSPAFFPSVMPLNGNLENRYYSLFGSYPKNCYNSSIDSSSFANDEIMESKADDKENVTNKIEASCPAFYDNIMKLTDQTCHFSKGCYSIFPPISSSHFCQTQTQISKNANDSFFSSSCTFPFENEMPQNEHLKKNRKYLPPNFKNKQQKNSINLEMNEHATTSYSYHEKNTIMDEKRSCCEINKNELYKLSQQPSNLLLCSPQKCQSHHFPEPGWDEKLIQRIESFRSFRHIQNRIAVFRRQYRRGFRYRSKQRAPLRIQLLKYKCLNSIYDDFEFVMQVRKLIYTTDSNKQ